jgi:hypothetical protein
MYEMLYYPLVHPPQRTVFQAVLYWDRLTSMVPEVHQGFEAYVLRPDLAALEDAGLYRRTMLERVHWEPGAMDDIVRNVQAIQGEVAPGTLDIPDELNSYTRLWSSKLPTQIEDELLRMGVVVEHEAGTLRGNPHLLFAVLAITAERAAVTLSNRTRHMVVPTTTDRFALECAIAPSPSSGTSVSWMANIGSFLPVPDSDTPIDQVIAFRSAYDDERKRCIKAVRELQARLRQEIADPREVIHEMKEEIAEATSDLKAAGRRFRWMKTSIWSLVGLAGAAGAAVPIGDVATPTEVMLNAASSLISTAGITLALVPSRPPRNPYVYLHQLESRFQFASIPH